MVYLSILSLLFAFHELGHWTAAQWFGHSIRFRLGWAPRFWVPRVKWDMPRMEKWKQNIVGLSGFGLEFIAGVPMLFIDWDFGIAYLIGALIHLGAHCIYAPPHHDFQWWPGRYFL